MGVYNSLHCLLVLVVSIAGPAISRYLSPERTKIDIAILVVLTPAVICSAGSSVCTVHTLLKY